MKPYFNLLSQPVIAMLFCLIAFSCSQKIISPRTSPYREPVTRYSNFYTQEVSIRFPRTYIENYIEQSLVRVASSVLFAKSLESGSARFRMQQVNPASAGSIITPNGNVKTQFKLPVLVNTELAQGIFYDRKERTVDLFMEFNSRPIPESGYNFETTVARSILAEDEFIGPYRISFKDLLNTTRIEEYMCLALSNALKEVISPQRAMNQLRLLTINGEPYTTSVTMLPEKFRVLRLESSSVNDDISLVIETYSRFAGSSVTRIDKFPFLKDSIQWHRGVPAISATPVFFHIPIEKVEENLSRQLSELSCCTSKSIKIERVTLSPYDTLLGIRLSIRTRGASGEIMFAGSVTEELNNLKFRSLVLNEKSESELAAKVSRLSVSELSNFLVRTINIPIWNNPIASDNPYQHTPGVTVTAEVYKSAASNEVDFFFEGSSLNGIIYKKGQLKFELYEK